MMKVREKNIKKEETKSSPKKKENRITKKSKK